jgi:hypothetical protein
MLQSSGGFARAELNKIVDIVRKHRPRLLEAWHKYFGN